MIRVRGLVGGFIKGPVGGPPSWSAILWQIGGPGWPPSGHGFPRFLGASWAAVWGFSLELNMFNSHTLFSILVPQVYTNHDHVHMR